MELYTIMRFIDERALGPNPLAFRDRYVLLDRFGSIQGYQHTAEVSRKLASLVLRRTKQETLSELPPLIEKPLWLSLTDVQRKIYRELRGEARELLSQNAWDAVHTNNAMVLLQRLREVCDTPELIDPLHTESQKLSELQAILADEVGALDRQAIIFTQWTRMGEILVRELTAAGYGPAFLHGGLDSKQRNAVIEQFVSGQARVFISTDAGGVGLNLQNASLVVNFDLPFNPAKLSQRIGRAWRLGQQNTVVVVNLLCKSTVEESLLRILEEKRALFDDVFGELSDPDQARPALAQQRTLRELLATAIAE
jgi:SNF2 family DNA or RNA helicase